MNGQQIELRSQHRSSIPLAIWVIFSIALILRTAFLLHSNAIGSPMHHDGRLYIALANGLDHGVFSMFHPLDIPETTRMPAYPFLVHLLGIDVLVIVQVILSAAKVPLLFLILRELNVHGPAIMITTLALMAIEPMDIVLSASLLTGSLFTFTLLVAIFFLVRSRNWVDIFFAILAFAFAAYLRPNGFHLAIIAGILLFLRSLSSRTIGTVLLLSLIILLLPWVIRNHSIDGRFHLSDSGNVVAAHFHVPQVLGSIDGSLADEHKAHLRQLAEATDWPDPESSRTYFTTIGKEVRAVLLDHPIQWLIVQFEEAARIVVAPGRGHISMFFDRTSIAYQSVFWLSVVLSILIVLILLSIIIHLRDLKWEQWLFIAMIFFLIFSAAISTADARFKNPAMPLILLLGAWIADRWRSKTIDRGDAQALWSS